MGYLRLFIFFALFFAMGFLPCAESVAAGFPPAHAVALSVPVYLGKSERGMAQMLIAPDSSKSYVQAEPLIAILHSLLPEAKLQAIRAAAVQGFVRLDDIERAGVDIRFDERLIGIVMAVPSENKRTQSLSGRHDFDLSHRSITPPSPVSAYMNFRGSQDYIGSGSSGGQDGQQAFRMSTDGAVNIGGWVLESAGDYLEDSNRPWARGDTRLVHDLPDDMVRLAAGDLSYPVTGFQSFQPMGGVTIARDFDLQPYRVSEPTGQTSFFLKSPSRVDVFVNDHKTQTLQLDSGPFDIRNFPVVNGSNDVQLVITDATGRVEIKNLDIVSAANLLASGLHQYAYNIGVASNIVNRDIRYDTGQPVLSAFHRYGVSDALTVGANMQGDRDQQMSGLEMTTGGRWGILSTDLAGSHRQAGGSGFAVKSQYSLIRHGGTGANGIDTNGAFEGARTLTASAEYRNVSFVPLGVIQAGNNVALDLSLGYSLQWSETVNVGAGGRYEIGRNGQKDDWTASASIGKNLPHDLRVSLNLEQQRQEGTGAFITLTWVPRGSRHAVSASYDSSTKTARTDWSYAEEGRSDSISASAGVARTNDRDQADGNLTYYNNRAEITARQDVVTPFGNDGASSATQSRSELNFGTALAYSGGHVAFSRPIGESFAMVAPHPALAGYPIGVDPRSGGEQDDYEAKTDLLGPAVLPDVTPYLYRTVRVDASRLPPGFDTGDESYTLHPGYRSGTLIEIGSGANVLLDGTLNYPDGRKVALEAGSIRSVRGSDISPPFFTNRAGRFRIEKLRPGAYVMELYRYPGVTMPVTIPEDAAGPIQAGELTVPVSSAEEGNTP